MGERLTGRDKRGRAYIEKRREDDDCYLFIENNYYIRGDAAERLAAYEDAEEQGLLIRLPCMVGDKLYAPTRYFISEFKVKYIEVYSPNHMFVAWELCKGITCEFRIDGIAACEIGKSVFLTKEEAEAALERMKKDG